MKHASAQARERHYLVIGPWDHAGTRTPKESFGGLTIGAAGMVDLLRLHLQWYAWVMNRGQKPELLRKRVAYYVMGAERWRFNDSLEQITARVQPLYLTSGALVPEPSPDTEPDQYVYDPRDVSLAELESTLDPASLVEERLVVAAAARQVTYHSAPFAKALELSGFVRLTVWLSIDQPDTDISAVVSEVRDDGSVVRLTEDRLRARYRESLRTPRLIATTEPLRYYFELFTFVSRQIAKGSRLRLVIGPVNSIYREKNYNSGGTVADESIADARVVTVRIYHDGTRPSALHVPVGADREHAS